MKTMKTKITLASVVIGVVIAGTALALGTSSAWQAPTKPFPDTGGVVGSLDEGSGGDTRAGVIDFSATPTSTTFVFGQNQGVVAIPDTGAFNVFSGDFKIATRGKGLIFPDGTIQYTAPGGMFTLGKLCQANGSGWKNTTLAPDSWTAAECGNFLTKTGGTSFQIGCANSGDTSFGTVGGGIPNPNCGWSIASGGLYYPYAPVGNPTPQKVIASANQPSVASGVNSVITVPTRDQIAALCTFKFPLEQCTRTVCDVPTTVYAAPLACGAYIYDNEIQTSGSVCGTGNVYQVYCR